MVERSRTKIDLGSESTPREEARLRSGRNEARVVSARLVDATPKARCRRAAEGGREARGEVIGEKRRTSEGTTSMSKEGKKRLRPREGARPHGAWSEAERCVDANGPRTSSGGVGWRRGSSGGRVRACGTRHDE